jgi:hypothetical protein
MKSTFVATLIAGAAADSFESWKAQFGKVYNGAEEEHARANFEANDKLIAEHNAQGLSYTLGHNQFSDMNIEEFAATYLTLQQPSVKYEGAPKLGTHAWAGEPLADSVDWVSAGAVTKMKDQGGCGSCWAFSTTGSLEGAWQLASGQLAPMSEQQFIDCDHNGDQGCEGGLMDNAFSWLQSTKAATCSEASYPYKGRAGTCSQTSCSTVIPSGGVTGHKDVQSSEESLMSALMQQPVSIAVEADRATFQMYSSGIMSGACGTNLNHGILAVGYGEDNGQKYWKIKNSWGTSWGEAGYGQLLRGKGGKGECGILSQPSYPVVSAAPGPAPTPTPPAPTPTPPAPTPGGSHYEKPPCSDDEMQGDVVDASGATVGSVCAPECDMSGNCPSDVPTGTTALPMCALQDQDTGKQYCALSCYLDSGCPDEASCAMIGGIFGVCLYPGQAANGAHFTAISAATV